MLLIRLNYFFCKTHLLLGGISASLQQAGDQVKNYRVPVKWP